jgi:hypothetical protein
MQDRPRPAASTSKADPKAEAKDKLASASAASNAPVKFSHYSCLTQSKSYNFEIIHFIFFSPPPPPPALFPIVLS